MNNKYTDVGKQMLRKADELYIVLTL
jgi:hypothetical protein